MQLKGDFKTIISEIKNQSCIITINRPEINNKINLEAVEEIAAVIEGANKTSSVRTIILTGAGSEFFCGGGQIDSFPDGFLMEQRAYADGTVKLQQAIYSSAKPIIAAVQGNAYAGGLSVLDACDIAIAASKSTFGLTELVTNGQFPMIAQAANMRTIPKKVLFEMIFLGKTLNAQEALELHIINQIVDDNKVLERALQIADNIAQYSETAIKIGRQSYYEMVNMPQNVAYSYSKAALLNLLWTEDVQETGRARQEGRHPHWIGK